MNSIDIDSIDVNYLKNIYKDLSPQMQVDGLNNCDMEDNSFDIILSFLQDYATVRTSPLNESIITNVIMGLWFNKNLNFMAPINKNIDDKCGIETIFENNSKRNEVYEAIKALEDNGDTAATEDFGPLDNLIINYIIEKYTRDLVNNVFTETLTDDNPWSLKDLNTYDCGLKKEYLNTQNIKFMDLTKDFEIPDGEDISVYIENNIRGLWFNMNINKECKAPIFEDNSQTINIMDALGDSKKLRKLIIDYETDRTGISPTTLKSIPTVKSVADNKSKLLKILVICLFLILLVLLYLNT